MAALPTTTDHDSGLEPGFWFGNIDEDAASDFVDLTPRTLQALRQRGGGPYYVRVSSRCIRYRRIDLRAWAERLLRNSTR